MIAFSAEIDFIAYQKPNMNLFILILKLALKLKLPLVAPTFWCREEYPMISFSTGNVRDFTYYLIHACGNPCKSNLWDSVTAHLQNLTQKNVAFLGQASEPTKNNYKANLREGKQTSKKIKLIYKKMWIDQHHLRKNLDWQLPLGDSPF